MCGGMSYQYIDPKTGEIKTRKVYFPIPNAKIPVVAPDQSEPAFFQWGKRKGLSLIHI